MTVGIIGSGFGLYAYFPAIAIGCRQQILLPQRYRERLRSRADVGDLADLVEWVASDDAVLDGADTIVISQRPADQVDRVHDCLQRNNIAALMLEKPLAPNPEKASLLLATLEHSGKRFCIGYVFRYTEWGRVLLALAQNLKDPIHIDWYFRAHHYAVGAENWKRRVSTGGGALRFYGIHLIALLAEAGYDQVVSSYVGTQAPDEAESWHAVIAGTDLPDCHISVDTNHDAKSFRISAGQTPDGEKLSFTQSDPFNAAGVSGKFDDRVTLLTEYCRDFFQHRLMLGNSYERAIKLWDKIEAKTRVEPSLASLGERISI